jgi:hypothetical protein
VPLIEETSFTGDVSFGEGGNIFASNINNNSFDLNIFNNKVTVILQLLGRHNIDNASDLSPNSAIFPSTAIFLPVKLFNTSKAYLLELGLAL